ncbi:hypothetical protein [Cutibacterium avidum]|uniref:hypothetical protein n=1 Tax=Cutibacterium avidum TaxID=33010 RepID=UPI001C54AFD1|nr:hypothetical protein [Cutibacterium avidum]
MTITMLDSAAGMRAMLHSSPGQWPEAARRLWEPMAGMYFFIPGGPDMAAVHGQNFGFGSGAPRQEMVDALHRLEQADACGPHRAVPHAGHSGLGDGLSWGDDSRPDGAAGPG